MRKTVAQRLSRKRCKTGLSSALGQGRCEEFIARTAFAVTRPRFAPATPGKPQCGKAREAGPDGRLED
jgi:hypothetical protein